MAFPFPTAIAFRHIAREPIRQGTNTIARFDLCHVRAHDTTKSTSSSRYVNRPCPEEAATYLAISIYRTAFPFPVAVARLRSSKTRARAESPPAGHHFTSRNFERRAALLACSIDHHCHQFTARSTGSTPLASAASTTACGVSSCACVTTMAVPTTIPTTRPTTTPSASRATRLGLLRGQHRVPTPCTHAVRRHCLVGRYRERSISSQRIDRVARIREQVHAVSRCRIDNRDVHARRRHR